MASKPPTAIQTVLQRITHLKRPRTVIGLGAVALTLALTAFGLTSAITPPPLKASDHDDGDIDVRSRALSLTDLYAFREVDQNPSASSDDLILVMNTNPRSLARQQYFFSDQARYEFRISRVADNNAVPTGKPDVTLRFEFSKPDSSGRQKMTITTLSKGKNGGEEVITRTTENRPIYTTPLAPDPNAAPTVNQITVGGSTLSVFAGLREDPFFFDVEQYFRVRAAVAGIGPGAAFRPSSTAVDFTKGYNVNTVVVRVPRSFLQGSTPATTFDVWLSLLTPDLKTGTFKQTEQLARPGINELLTSSSQKIYELYNRTQPATVRPEVRDNIKAVLQAVGNPADRAEALVTALLPDVMRIDTTGPSGYGNALNTLSAPIRGRKLLDDVVDISLGLVTNGAITTDNVSYEGTPGNPAQGHQPLAPAFPYLALPN